MKTFEAFKLNTKDEGFEKACKYLLEKLDYDCELTKDSGDDGIDIIATKDDLEIGIQCKNYEDKVSNDKIRDFSGALQVYGIANGIFMTTSTFTGEAIKTAKKLGIELWDYTKIKGESSKLGFDLETLKFKKTKTIKSVVFPHNVEVYKQMDNLLNTSGKVLVTMGTGIGKTTTALEYCIQHKCRGLVICPSNIIKDSWKNNKANIIDNLVDVDTYQSFARKYKDIDYSEYGVVIFDEVHHGGAETWGAGIKYLIDNNIKVIGLTATEERTDGINVANTLFDNNIVEGLDILSGIREGIVYPFTYVGALYDASKVCKKAKEKYGDKLTELLLGKLDTALNNTKEVRDIVKADMPKGNRKGIIFSATIESMEDDIKLIKDIYPKAEIKKIHSNMSYNEQKTVKEWFANTKSGYICTVAMINEGAHYDNVNTIFMLRKTSSELIFLQQLGRAITSIYGHKDPHTIVFDLVNSSKAIQNVKRKFKESGVEESVKAVEVTEEQYDAIVEAIDNGVIAPVENDDIIEISSEDIEVLAEASDIKIDLENEKVHEKVRELTRTIYVKDKIEFNTDYDKSKQVIVKDYTRPIVEVIEELHNEFNRKLWTEKEDEILKKYYPLEGTDIINRLEFHQSKGAISQRAEFLNVKFINCSFTQEEDNLIIKYYPEEGTKMYSKLNNKTRAACKNRAKALGVNFHDTSWTEVEDNILKEYYLKEGREVYKKLNNRTAAACGVRAKQLNLVTNKKGKSWTTEEDNILITYYPLEGTDAFKRLSERTILSCKNRLKKLGIIFSKKWSNEEDAILIANYSILGKDITKLLPNRNFKQCKTRAAKFHLKLDKSLIDSLWTEEEDKILKQYYHIEGKSISIRLQNRTPSACARRANILHLKIDVPMWTDEEDNILRNNYPRLGTKAFNLINNHDNNDCKNRVKKLGIKMSQIYNQKKVKCVETGEVFLSGADAKRNYTRCTNICNCCKDNSKTTGGYHWEYVEE